MQLDYIGQSGSPAVFAEVRIKSVTGEPAIGFHRLFVGLELFTRPNLTAVQVRLTDLHGELRVVLGQQSVSLGRLVPRVLPIEIRLHETPSNYHPQLEVELDPRRLHVLDELRGGKGLRFCVSLRARLLAGDRSFEPGGEDYWDLNQGTCIELFKAMGFADRLLLEVPSPSAVANPSLAEAVDHLTQAQSHLQHGRWRDAVAACRDVLESLSRGLGDGGATDLDVQGPLFQNTRPFSKAQRLQLVRRALKVLTHAAKHSDEHTAAIEWTPSDARATVVMVAALLAQLGT